MFKSSLYSLKKSRTIMRHSVSFFNKRKKKLSPDTIEEFEKIFIPFDDALLANDRETASSLAKELEILSKKHLKKNGIEYFFELVIALALALFVATVVRQVWFELYKIPTGSMRPTFEEEDRLTVTKTAFGINTPFLTNHFYFDPELVQRTGIVIFSGDGIDLQDTDTTYFWLFPAKKRYIKRLIGKPGDTLYFYGGKIFGIDRNGNRIEEYQDSPWMSHLEHIPFLTFDGRIEGVSPTEIQFKQMNKPLGRVIERKYRGPVGEIFVNGEWIEEEPAAQSQPDTTIKNYSDFYGMKNFALARLLTKDQLKQVEGVETSSLDDGALYLELAHHPSLTYPHPLLDPYSLQTHTIVNSQRSIIPLKEEHLKKIMENLYTGRFIIKNNHATRYSPNGAHFSQLSPRFNGVADGTYEFYFGKASKVGIGGYLTELPKNHPLYLNTEENIQKLYNLGIDWMTMKNPSKRNQNNFPRRYAYFRDGDLYLLGAPILTKNDPTLEKFIIRENKRAEAALPRSPYIPFVDNGPPRKNGEIDSEFINTFGIRVPEGHYLVLGDNHAMSSDSRYFGFVPQENLEGVPSVLFWPPGERWGFPLQIPHPFLTLPRGIIWILATSIGTCFFFYYRSRNKKRIYKK